MVHQLFNVFTALGSDWVLVVMFCLSVLMVAVIGDRVLEIRRAASMSRKFWEQHGDRWFATSDGKSWEKEVEILERHYPCVETEILALIRRLGAQDMVQRKQVVHAYLQNHGLVCWVYGVWVGRSRF